MSRQVVCPICNGKVGPPAHSRRITTEQAFKNHINTMHEDLRGKPLDVLLAACGFRTGEIPEEE